MYAKYMNNAITEPTEPVTFSGSGWALSVQADVKDKKWKMGAKISLLCFHGESNDYLYQGLFCHDQVSLGKFLAFFNLCHNLQTF